MFKKCFQFFNIKISVLCIITLEEDHEYGCYYTRSEEVQKANNNLITNICFLKEY
jgi:hypothetical protein